MGRKAVLVMILFNDLLNNFSFIDGAGFVRILCFSISVELMKQCIDPEFIRI